MFYFVQCTHNKHVHFNRPCISDTIQTMNLAAILNKNKPESQKAYWFLASKNIFKYFWSFILTKLANQLTIRQTNIKNGTFPSFASRAIAFTRNFQDFHCFISGNLKWLLISAVNNRVADNNTCTCQVWEAFMLPTLRYHVYNPFGFQSLVTSHDHWPLPKVLEFFLSSMKSIYDSYLAVLCSWGF